MKSFLLNTKGNMVLLENVFRMILFLTVFVRSIFGVALLEQAGVAQACYLDENSYIVCLQLPATFNLTHSDPASSFLTSGEFTVTSVKGGPIRVSCIRSNPLDKYIDVFKDCDGGTEVLQMFSWESVTWNPFHIETYFVNTGGCDTVLVETTLISDYPEGSFCETAAKIKPNQNIMYNFSDVVFEARFSPCGSHNSPHSPAGSWIKISGTDDILSLSSLHFNTQEEQEEDQELCSSFVSECACLESSQSYEICAEETIDEANRKEEENGGYFMYIVASFESDEEISVEEVECPEELGIFKEMFPCNTPRKCNYTENLEVDNCTSLEFQTSSTIEYACDSERFSTRCITDHPIANQDFVPCHDNAAEILFFMIFAAMFVIPFIDILISYIFKLRSPRSTVTCWETCTALKNGKGVIAFNLVQTVFDYGIIFVFVPSKHYTYTIFIIFLAVGHLWNIICLAWMIKSECSINPAIQEYCKSKALYIGVFAMLVPKLDCFSYAGKCLNVPYSRNLDQRAINLSSIQYILEAGKFVICITFGKWIDQVNPLMDYCYLALLYPSVFFYVISPLWYTTRTIANCCHHETLSVSDDMRAAVLTGDIEKLSTLIESNADVNLKFDDGTSLLTKAGYAAYPKVMTLLIEKKANLNAHDSVSKKTPLMIAAKNGYSDVVELMLLSDLPPSIDVQTSKGKSPLNYAKSSSIREFMKTELILSKILFISGEKLTDIQHFGEGNFSDAYTANMEFEAGNEVFTVKVVCKTPKNNDAGSDEIHEIRVLHSVPYHPNILSLLALCLDFSEGSSNFASVIPLKEGGSVKDLVDSWNEPPSRNILATFALDIAKGLLHLHDHGFIHRDIKLDNCFLQRAQQDVSNEVFCKQRAVVADFGLSRPIKSKMKKNEKLFWSRLPLEFFEDGIANTKTDVYMMGLAFWELHQMREPFPNVYNPNDLKKFLRDHRSSGIPFDFPDHCTDFFRDLIQRTCAIDPAQRLKDRDVVGRLENYVGEYPKDAFINDVQDDVMEMNASNGTKTHNTIAVPGLNKDDGYIDISDFDINDDFKDIPQSEEESSGLHTSHSSSGYGGLAPGNDGLVLGGYHGIAPGNSNNILLDNLSHAQMGDAVDVGNVGFVYKQNTLRGSGGVLGLNIHNYVPDDSYVELSSGESD